MIGEVIKRLNGELPATVKLVAVSKFHPFEAIEEAYAAGQRLFAESRPQELLAKVRRLEEIRAERGEPDYMSDIEWHFIGHLQTNKLKMVLPYVSLVQSVDSIRLLEAIDRWGAANGKVVNVLIECHVAAEESKQGFSEEELIDLLSSDVHYTHVRICGIMGMATFTDDDNVIRSDFQRLLDMQQTLHDWIGESPNVRPGCNELSMGMSDDYPIAVSMGSTIVRIGSMIFGERS
ncbi:MAG: YggS family pyridoxal phosphate-dependent enzyme [Bacteroidales bacterium]|nr:YggS family pyridoxal phosphate-dependent enzyme [Bacteroidales bacterium]